MSWSVSVHEDGKHVAGAFEAKVKEALGHRNGFEQTAMKALVPVVETLAKHAALTPYKVSVSASGHHGEDGCGGISLSVSVHAPVIEALPEKSGKPASGEGSAPATDSTSETGAE